MVNHYLPGTIGVNTYSYIKHTKLETTKRTYIELQDYIYIYYCFMVSISQTYELYQLSMLFVQYLDPPNSDNQKKITTIDWNTDTDTVMEVDPTKFINLYYQVRNSIIDHYKDYYCNVKKINLAFFYNDNVEIPEYDENNVNIAPDALNLINEYNEIISNDDNKQCTIALFNCSKYYINELITIIKTQNIDDTNASNNDSLDSLNNFDSLNKFESTTEKNTYVSVIANIFVYINKCRRGLTKQKPLINNVIYLTILLNNFVKTLTMQKVIFEKLYNKEYIKMVYKHRLIPYKPSRDDSSDDSSYYNSGSSSDGFNGFSNGFDSNTF
jgi:hypothetical protein